MATSFWDLPADIFGVLTSYITFQELSRLIVCGNKRIMRTIAQPSAVVSLELRLEEKSVKRAFPNFAAFLPFLRSLYIGNPECSSGFTLSLRTPLNLLPSTLEYLEMSHWECEQWFSKIGVSQRLDHPPPIDLSTQRDDIDDLQVKESPISASSENSPFPHLKTLIIRGSPSPRLVFWNMAKMTPILQTLKLESSQGITLQMMKNLPPDLTVLSIPRASTLPSTAFSSLPASLAVLYIDSHAWKDPKELLVLPRDLATLKMQWSLKLGLQSASQHLPRSLTCLEVFFVAAEMASSEWVQSLPRSLTKLDVYGYSGEAKIPNDVAVFLPAHLTDLNGLRLDIPSNAPASTILLVPQHLTALRVKQSPYIDGRELGPILPSSLRSLVLQGLVTHGAILMNYLPNGLHTLDISLDGFNPKESPVAFPAALTRLNFYARRPALGFRLELPSQLVYLTFKIYEPYSQQWWPDTLPSTLRELHLSSLNISILHALPSSLRKLTFLDAGGDVFANSFGPLPATPELQHVEIRSGYPTVVCNKLVTLLPPSITSLTLDVAPNANLTYDCLPHLPSHLRHLSLPQDLQLEWTKMRKTS